LPRALQQLRAAQCGERHRGEGERRARQVGEAGDEGVGRRDDTQRAAECQAEVGGATPGRDVVALAQPDRPQRGGSAA
jgi:hypothetical protein